MALRQMKVARFVSGLGLALDFGLMLGLVWTMPAISQVFVVGGKTATADLSADFTPTNVDLPTAPLTERGRRDLIRNLEAEQGFAHRALPLGDTLVLHANGDLTPGGDAYKQMIFKKGESAAPGDRVVITAVVIKADRIVFDLNGGPYLKHRFLRHIELNGMGTVQGGDQDQVTGSRITLVFKDKLPEISAPEVKALLDPILDFGVKTSVQAYADTLPQFLRDSIASHDILVGMNRRMVIAAAGAPENKIRELVEGSSTRHYEEWIYGHQPQTVRFVRLEGDRVTQVRVAALGKPIAIHDKDELNGFLEPLPTRNIAVGDATPHDPDKPAPPPPSLRLPGEPEAPGASNRVQYPVPGKDKPAPIPAAPGSPADTSTPDPTLQTPAPAPSMPGRRSATPQPTADGSGTNPNDPGALPTNLQSSPF